MISKLFSFFGYKKQAATTRDRAGWFVEWAQGGTDTVSGEKIGNENALAIATVFACINNISTDIAKLPVKVFQKKGNRRVELDDHPLRRILDKHPNPEMTSMDYRQASTAHALGWGNGYSEIQRYTDGSIAGLYPLKPGKITIKRDDKSKRLFYEIFTDDGYRVDVWAENILHVHGLGFDGLQGYNVIRYARESLGLAKATEKFGASFFGNGTVPGGFLEHPKNLSPESQKNLINSLEGRYQGASKAHRIAVLEEGMKFTQNTIPPEESQFLETRQFSVPEICRWFRMPPHKVADLTRSTFSNIEEQNIDYVTDTLTPWLRRWEQAIWMRLLSEEEKNAGVYVEHVTEALLKGNIQGRYGAYQIAIGNNNNPAFMTVNEVRDRENLNPVPGGDELFTPASKEAGIVGPDEAVIDDMAARIYGREQQEFLHSQQKHGELFDADSFYEKFTPKQCEYISKVIAPLDVGINPIELIGKTQDEVKDILCTTKYSTV